MTKKTSTRRAARGAKKPSGALAKLSKTVGEFLLGSVEPAARIRAPRTKPSVRPSLRPSIEAELREALLSMSTAPDPTASPKRRPVSILAETKEKLIVRLSSTELANAWLFGVLFDHMIKAERAWAGPVLLANRLGHLDVQRIAKISEKELGEALRGRPGEPALHRLWPRLARSIRGTSQLLVRKYGGEAERVWPDGISVADLKTRLAEFPGLGPKLAAMTVRLLVDVFGRKIGGWEDADVAVDRHVARVFLRTGLITGAAGKTRYRIHEVREDVLAAARRLHPAYPGALDLGAFMVGEGFCRAREARCAPCPLSGSCPQNRRAWGID